MKIAATIAEARRAIQVLQMKRRVQWELHKETEGSLVYTNDNFPDDTKRFLEARPTYKLVIQPWLAGVLERINRSELKVSNDACFAHLEIAPVPVVKRVA